MKLPKDQDRAARIALEEPEVMAGRRLTQIGNNCRFEAAVMASRDSCGSSLPSALRDGSGNGSPDQMDSVAGN
jgi:hypothetical protein